MCDTIIITPLLSWIRLLRPPLDLHQSVSWTLSTTATPIHEPLQGYVLAAQGYMLPLPSSHLFVACPIDLVPSEPALPPPTLPSLPSQPPPQHPEEARNCTVPRTTTPTTSTTLPVNSVITDRDDEVDDGGMMFLECSKCMLRFDSKKALVVHNERFCGRLEEVILGQDGSCINGGTSHNKGRVAKAYMTFEEVRKGHLVDLNGIPCFTKTMYDSFTSSLTGEAIPREPRD